MINLETHLFFLVIFGIIGFITDKIFGFNPYKFYSDLGADVFIITIIFFIFPVTINPDPEIAIKSFENLLTFFTNSLPSIIIGNIAGTIISKFTGG